MSFDITAATFLLKEHYNGQTVKTLTYKNNPLHALLPKYTKFGGKNKPQPLIYGTPQGRSATFSNALAQKSPTKGVSFFITRVQDYALADVDNETLLATQGDSNAFLEAATTEFDGAFVSLTRSLAQAEYRTGTGSIGVVGSGETTPTITLASPADVVNFEVGMTLQVSATDGGTLRTGSTVITAIDRSAGTITAGGPNWDDDIAAIAPGDFILVAGDFNKKVSGLGAWIPYTAPDSTAFFGVDRTADVSRLAGQRQDLSALPIEEALVEQSALIAREGGTPDNCLMNFANYANLEKALGAKVQYVNVKDEDGIVGFEGIKVHGQKGFINVIPDHNCQSDLMYMLQMDTWSLDSLGDAPMMLMYEGNEYLRTSSADSVEGRAGYYAQLNGGRAPGWNGVAKIR